MMALTNFPAMSFIPEATFFMGSEQGEDDERPVHAVTLDAFLMDQHPITNSQFKLFLRENPLWQKQPVIKKYLNPYYLYLWRKELIFPQGKRDHPVVYVNWFVAAAYCNWRSQQQGLMPCYDPESFVCRFDASGFRLPTEAEYECAARGGHRQRTYPWGDDITKAVSNYDNHVGNTTEICAYPANDFGLFDMGGNVSSWCQDWFDENYYRHSPQQNPRGPEQGTHKVYRGGAWGGDEDRQRCAMRRWLLPFNCNPDFSFRCVRKA